MNWYEEEVAELIQRRNALTYKPQTIFYGSSTIRMWDSLYNDFKNCQPINLGFGGSTLEACVWFFERIVAPVTQANTVFVYAGDNDLGDGKEPENVLNYFEAFVTKMNRYFPGVGWYYISVKPSISRWNINDKIKRTNELIKAAIKELPDTTFLNIYPAMLDEKGYPNVRYFDDDGLHLSKQGYAVWKHALENLCLTETNQV